VSAVKYRIHKWGHVLTGEVMYGIQGKPAGESRYLHCCEGTEPLIFKTRDEASAKLRQIRAKQPTPPDPGHEREGRDG
jgi:hypothetical protein